MKDRGLLAIVGALVVLGATSRLALSEERDAATAFSITVRDEGGTPVTGASVAVLEWLKQEC